MTPGGSRTRCLTASLVMNINRGIAVGFLGIFSAVFIVNQVSKLYRTFWPPISRWFVRHVVLPRLSHGRHMFNPTRVELLCHLLHWVAVILCSSLSVTNLSHAASRAGHIAVVHIVPLSISYQLSFVSRAFGLSLNAMLKVHRSLAIMATIQSTLHGLLRLQIAGGYTKLTLFQTMVPCPFDA